MNSNGVALGHGGTHLGPIPWATGPTKGLADLVYGWPLVGRRRTRNHRLPTNQVRDSLGESISSGLMPPAKANHQVPLF